MREVAAEVNHSLMQDIADCDLRRQQQQAQQAQQQGRQHGRRHAMDLLAMAAASIGGSSLSPGRPFALPVATVALPVATVALPVATVALTERKEKSMPLAS